MTSKEAREKTVKAILKGCAKLEPGCTAVLTAARLHEEYGGPKPQTIGRVAKSSLKSLGTLLAAKREDLTIRSYRRSIFEIERAPIPEICGTCDDFAQSARFRRTEYLIQGYCQSGMACSKNGQRVNREDICRGGWRPDASTQVQVLEASTPPLHHRRTGDKSHLRRRD